MVFGMGARPVCMDNCYYKIHLLCKVSDIYGFI